MRAKAVVKGPLLGMPAEAETLEQAGTKAESRRGEHRQHRVDTKAFKGRGEPEAVLPYLVPGATGSRLLREALAAVERLHVEMADLVALTQEIRARHVHLCLHRRHATQQVSLRWRQCDTKGAHVPWRLVPDVLSCDSPALRHWYAEVDRRARELNEQEIAARHALKRAQRDAALCEPRQTRRGGGWA